MQRVFMVPRRRGHRGGLGGLFPISNRSIQGQLEVTSLTHKSHQPLEQALNGRQSQGTSPGPLPPGPQEEVHSSERRPSHVQLGGREGEV